jgi:hypothetical protein
LVSAADPYSRNLDFLDRTSRKALTRSLARSTSLEHLYNNSLEH